MTTTPSSEFPEHWTRQKHKSKRAAGIELQCKNRAMPVWNWAVRQPGCLDRWARLMTTASGYRPLQMIARLPEEKWEEVMDWAVEHSGGRWNELREMVNWVLYDLGPNEDKLVETLKGEIDLWVERHPRGTYGNAVDPIQRIAEYVAAGVERERSIHLRP